MRYLSIFTLLAASASFASASVISINCSPTIVNTGQTVTPGGTSTCAGFPVPAGSSIIAINYQYAIDFSFDSLVASSASINATINAPGANDVAITFNNGARPNQGTVNVALADFAGFISGASFFTGHTGSVGVTGSTFSVLVNFTYEVDQPTGGVPELWAMNASGGTATPVTQGMRGAGAEHPWWVPPTA